MSITVQDLFQFLQIPLLNRANALALVRALVAASPGNAGERLLKTREKLQAAADAFQQSWADRARDEAVADPSQAVLWDRAVDPLWGSLDDRLLTYAGLPVERYPRARRAGEIHATLFAGGRRFLTLPFTEEWAHCDTLLKRIDGEGLAADIDQFAGPEFLAELRYAHQQYGQALGKTAPLPGEADKVNFRQALYELADEIRAYAVQVIATADPDQPETVEAAHAALRPIEDLRAEVARHRNDSGNTTEPAPAPTPVVKPVTG